MFPSHNSQLSKNIAIVFCAPVQRLSFSSRSHLSIFHLPIGSFHAFEIVHLISAGVYCDLIPTVSPSKSKQIVKKNKTKQSPHLLENKASKQECTLLSGKNVCPELPLSSPPVLSQPPETALMFALCWAPPTTRPRSGWNPVAGNSVFMCFFQWWIVKSALAVEMEMLQMEMGRGVRGLYRRPVLPDFF